MENCSSNFSRQNDAMPKRKVVKIIDRRAVSKTGINNLRMCMKDVRDKEIVSFGFVGIKRDGSVVTAYNAETTMPLVGGVQYLSDRLLSDFKAKP
jgi:hypothetical protein